MEEIRVSRTENDRVEDLRDKRDALSRTLADVGLEMRSRQGLRTFSAPVAMDREDEDAFR